MNVKNVKFKLCAGSGNIITKKQPSETPTTTAQLHQ